MWGWNVASGAYRKNGGMKQMKLFKWSIVLLALLLAAMAMVPIVSAAERTSTNNSTLQLLGNKDTSIIQFDGISTLFHEATSEKDVQMKIPQSIKKYSIITIDVSTIKKELLSQKKVPIHLNEISYMMNLHEDTFYPSAETGVYTFTGHLENGHTGERISDSEVHLTMDNEGILGRISVTPTDYYIIDEIDNQNASKGPKTAQYVYSSKDVEPSKVSTGEDGVFTLPSGESKVYSQLSQDEIKWIVAQNENRSQKETQNGLRLTRTQVQTNFVDVNLLVLCDNQMYTGYSNWIKRAQSLVSDANTAMAFDDIKIRLVPIYDATQRTVLSNNFNLTQPVRSFHDLVGNSYLDSNNADIAMFLCSRQFNAGAGVIGQSTVFDNPNSDYRRHATIMYESASGWGYSANAQQRAAVFTHELGHLFDADAQGAGENPSIQTETYNRATTYTTGSGQTQYTVMYSGQLGDPNYFSSSQINHGDLSHDNSKRLSETKSIVAGYR